MFWNVSFVFHPVIALHFYACLRWARSTEVACPTERRPALNLATDLLLGGKTYVTCLEAQQEAHEHTTAASETVHRTQFIELDCSFIHSMKGFPDSTWILSVLLNNHIFTLYCDTLSLKHYSVGFFPTTYKRRFTTRTVQECLYNIFESQNVNLKYITVIRTLP